MYIYVDDGKVAQVQRAPGNVWKLRHKKFLKYSTDYQARTP